MSSLPVSNGQIFGAVGKYGGATVIALYLVWQMAGNLPQIQGQHIQMMGSISELEKGQETLKETLDSKLDTLIGVVKTQCVIQAKTNQDKKLCNQ